MCIEWINEVFVFTCVVQSKYLRLRAVDMVDGQLFIVEFNGG